MQDNEREAPGSYTLLSKAMYCRGMASTEVQSNLIQANSVNVAGKDMCKHKSRLNSVEDAIDRNLFWQHRFPGSTRGNVLGEVIP